MYPVTILTDRYRGTYSGGGWLAFNLPPEEIPFEVAADDITCYKFWRSTDILVGLGSTPDEALKDLENKYGSYR